MIAFLGEIKFKSKAVKFSKSQIEKIDIAPRERTDDVVVNWKN